MCPEILSRIKAIALSSDNPKRVIEKAFSLIRDLYLNSKFETIVQLASEMIDMVESKVSTAPAEATIE